MTLNRLFLKIFSLTLFLGLTLSILINYLVDPIQYYRHSPYTKLDINDRWQVAGFIRSFDYNQIILGTSMTQNFSLENIKETMGTKPIKLSVSGLPILEQSIILKAAIKTGKVSSVIWGIDRNYLNYTTNSMDKSFPVELYNQSIMGHVNYLINISTLYASTINILSFIKKKKQKYDLEHYNTWSNQQYVFSKEVILQQYNETLNNIPERNRNLKTNEEIPKMIIEKPFFLEKEKQISNFNNDIFNIIKDNPNTTFYLFFPPYSLAFYKINFYSNPKEYYYDSELRKYMIDKLITLENVVFFDFETDLDIIANLDNYKDVMHYSKEINDIMICSFTSKKKLLNKEALILNHQTYLALPNETFR